MNKSDYDIITGSVGIKAELIRIITEQRANNVMIDPEA